MSDAKRLLISATVRQGHVVQDAGASIGFVRKREIVIQNASGVEVGRLHVGPKSRISVRPIRRGSPEFFAIIRRRAQRQRDRDRNAILRSSADALVLADASAVSRYETLLQALELALSRPPRQAWPDTTTRIRLPAICCSRPYFPAAP